MAALTFSQRTRSAPRRQAAARPRLAAPQLSVVIVNYRSWEETGRLVERLRRSDAMRRTAAEIVVVDNHSPSHPLIARMRRWPGVSIRRWQRNRGFARAVNEGCRLSRGGWFLLLNPDVTPADDFLDAALAAADRLASADARVGVVGFRLNNPDGGEQLSTGPFPTLAGTLARLCLPRARRKYRANPAQADAIDWATGCCLLIRRECWEELGGLDPQFFLYYEDVDFCRRAAERGWSVRFEVGPNVVHHRPLHARRVSPHMRLVTRHALLTYATRHWPAWQTRLLARIIRLEAAARGALAGVRRDPEAALAFRTLGQLAQDFCHAAARRAARRLRNAIEREEKLRDAFPVDRDPQP